MNYQVQIGETTFDFEVDNHQPGIRIVQAGDPVDYDFTNIHGNLYSLILNGKHYRVWLETLENGDYKVVVNQAAFLATVEDERQKLRKTFRSGQSDTAGVVQIKAPMPGLVVQVEVELNQHVNAGQGLVIVEAMKMENEIKSPMDGTVTKIKVKKGDAIEKEALLLEIEK